MDTIDPKCNLPNGLETYSDIGNDDESLLRQPIRTSCTGFREAKRAYENGTNEVRHLLMQECSIIYECNACRNMFRSLANFICHKRNYCKRMAKDNFSFFSDNNNSSVLIKTVERPEVWPNKSRSTGSSPIPRGKSSARDLSKVIERLKRVEVSPKCSESKDEVKIYKNEHNLPEAKATDVVIELERVSTTNQAVYQTFKMQNDCDSIKTELDEVNNLLTNDNTLLGPDGKVITNQTSLPNAVTFLSSQKNGSTKDTKESSKIFCEICKIHFQTEKTLRMHVQKKHNSSTYVFQCPTCSLTFLQPAAVIRHLANEHKKPLRRIRKMRDTILKKRIQIGDVQIKGPSREVKGLILDDNKECDTSYILNQQNGKSISSCMYCMKNFERRAALATHLSSCLMKKDSLKNIEEANKSSMIKYKQQVKQTKKHNQIPNQYLETTGSNGKLQNIVKHLTNIDDKEEPTDNLHSSKSPSAIKQMFEDLEKNTFGNGLQTVSLKKLEIIVNEKVEGSQSESNGKTEKNEEKKLKTKPFRVIPASKQLTCRCKICNKQFNALSNLRRHISMFHYRSRRFGCNLCDYRAFRRYDIVNHLTFVHKMTGERESMSIEHVTVHEIKYSKDDVEGDIVVVNEEFNVGEKIKPEESSKEKEILGQENVLKTYEKKDKRNNTLLQTNHIQEQHFETLTTSVSNDIPRVKVVRKKLKKTFVQQVESKKRPIRNRIKTVNKDFVYDLLSLKEEPKEPSRNALKRRNTMFVEENKMACIQHISPPLKIKPYKLRTEPLIPANKSGIKGFATNIYRNVIHEALAAPSTLPELPAERPQMRSRVISSSRSDCNPVKIIETSQLEAARLKSTFFDDSFLGKFAKKTNPSFKMKPLLALQHSPLNSILQKFDATLQSKSYNAQNKSFINPPAKTVDSSPPSYTVCPLESLNEKEITPNGKHIPEHSSPPSTPKKRITLMQRLAENRAKRRDSILRTALEN